MFSFIEQNHEKFQNENEWIKRNEFSYQKI